MQRLLPRKTEYRDPLPGLPRWLSDLLIARNIDTPEKAKAFLYPDWGMLNDPLLLHDMDKALSLLREAKLQGLRAVVYGDYDVDGITASVIMQETLTTFGLDAAVYIPDRHEEGYGLNAEAVRAISARAGLLVTVDCGITGVQEVALAKRLGLSVIVTDHHTVPETLPPADAVIDPLLAPYPFPSLCGAGVAFQLCRALLGDEAAKDCLDLAALASVADMVPLLDENRVIVKEGLKRLSRTERPGLRALIHVAGLPEQLRSEHIAFGLAPRLNACGRLESALTALGLLQTQNEDEAAAIALRLQRLNEERKTLEKAVIDSAEEQLAGMDLCESRAIVVLGEGFESGVVGLAAGRIAERTGYPTVILARQGEKAVGSARSAGEVDIYRALSECADLFERFGGHKQAAGMTLPVSRADELRARLSEAVARQLNGRALMPTRYYDAELKLSEVNEETVSRLSLLEPYGMGNPEPEFLMDRVELMTARAVGAAGAHLKLLLTDGEVRRNGIAFRMGELAAQEPQYARMIFTPTRNEFGGSVSFECRVSALLPEPFSGTADETALTEGSLQDFLASLENKDSLPCKQIERVSGFSGPIPVQGTLLFCRTEETARLLHRRYPNLDVLTRSTDDPRAYSAIQLGGTLTEIKAPYRTVALMDGDLTGRDEALIRAPYLETLVIPPRSEALKEFVSSMVPDLEGLRAVVAFFYRGGTAKSLRALAEIVGMPISRALTALFVLRHMELLDYTLTPFSVSVLPKKKADPLEDALYRALLSRKEGN
ncbi:MAG: single-stranded-DNA-specific exonuclease RecJ [Clostridia bacterium]|nr:single-stranded-DNA-specific exonuclease RecJ [Clostridia bacterium]